VEVLLKDGKVATAKLTEFIQQVKHPTNIAVHVTAGAPSSEISAVSKKQKANIVVLGNVGRTGIKGLLVGNTAEKILSQLMVDALIVK
jgi:universal stress protein E